MLHQLSVRIMRWMMRVFVGQRWMKMFHSKVSNMMIQSQRESLCCSSLIQN